MPVPAPTGDLASEDPIAERTVNLEPIDEGDPHRLTVQLEPYQMLIAEWDAASNTAK